MKSPGYLTTPNKSGLTSPFQRASLGSPATLSPGGDHLHGKLPLPFGPPGDEVPRLRNHAGFIRLSPFQRASLGSPATSSPGGADWKMIAGTRGEVPEGRGEIPGTPRAVPQMNLSSSNSYQG